MKAGVLMLTLLGAGLYQIPPVPKLDFSHMAGSEYFIKREAVVNGLRPEFIHGLVKTESNYNCNAVSSSGAKGIGQLMPHAISKVLTSDQDPHDCKTGIIGLARWLRLGQEEVNTKDENKLARWYYCGARLMNKVIYDKHFKKRELCGTSYAARVQQATTAYEKRQAGILEARADQNQKSS